MGHPSTANAITGRPQHFRRPSKWPFKVSDHGVGVPRRQEVEFRDGSKIWLHRVDRAAGADLFLRELGEPMAGVIVDLRQLLPATPDMDVGLELPITATADVAGLVHFALRGRFASRDAMLLEVQRLVGSTS